MAEPTDNDLTYGHFGHCSYTTEDTAWLWKRRLAASYILQPLSTSRWLVTPNRPLSHDGTRSTRHVQKNIQSVAQRLPVLGPATHVAAALSRQSEHITLLTARHDPALGDLLAYGRINDFSTKRTMSVVAFPVQASATMLRLMQVQPQKQGWEQNRSVWLDVPQIAGESGTWDACQPIRQVLFSHPRESLLTRRLAVRTSLSVHILRAQLTKATTWDPVQGVYTRFHLSSVVTVHLGNLGGIAPADVAFNPWYEKQFATADQNGTWRVWEVRNGKPFQVASAATADQSIPSASDVHRVLDDGWGRITWAATSSTLLIASRRALAIYHIESKPMRLAAPDLGLDNTPNWILDMVKCPRHDTIVYLITSSELLCLHIQPVDDMDMDSYHSAGARVVARFTHFRDPEDVSLRLSTYEDEEDTVVLIRSSLGPIVSTYRFSFSGPSMSPFPMVSDPALMMLPEDHAMGDATCIPVGLRVQRIEFGQSTKGGSGPGKVYCDASIRFYMVTVMSSDWSIVERIYAARPEGSTASKNMSAILPPHWHGRILYGTRRLPSKQFVVNDGDGGDQVSGSLEVEESDLHAAGRMPRPYIGKTSGGTWRIGYENLYQRMNSVRPGDTVDLMQALTVITDYANANGSRPAATTLLSDVVQDQIAVADIDEATGRFARLLSDYAGTGDGNDQDDRHSAARLEVSSLGVQAALGLSVAAKHEPSLEDVYDNIIRHWLTSLSQRVPGRIRLVKEQLSRRVAAEVCMSSYWLADSGRAVGQEEAFASAALPDIAARDSLSLSQRSAFPTPSPTATPSLTTVTSLSSHPSTMAAPELMRLQRYTTFSSAKVTPAPLPRAMAQKLGHWSVGGNPEEYDWLVVQRQQEKKAEEEDEGLSIRERARIKRRAEKHLRRQRRESEKAATMGLASSQAPEIVSTGGGHSEATFQKRGMLAPQVAAPATQGMALPSSQAVSSQAQPIPASQIEPGRFGGRAPAKKKRKRAIGF